MKKAKILLKLKAEKSQTFHSLVDSTLLYILKDDFNKDNKHYLQQFQMLTGVTEPHHFFCASAVSDSYVICKRSEFKKPMVKALIKVV
jgi:hypothetical protein